MTNYLGMEWTLTQFNIYLLVKSPLAGNLLNSPFKFSVINHFCLFSCYAILILKEIHLILFDSLKMKENLEKMLNHEKEHCGVMKNYSNGANTTWIPNQKTPLLPHSIPKTTERRRCKNAILTDTSQTIMASWLGPFCPCCVWRQVVSLAPFKNRRPGKRWSSSSLISQATDSTSSNRPSPPPLPSVPSCFGFFLDLRLAESPRSRDDDAEEVCPTAAFKSAGDQQHEKHPPIICDRRGGEPDDRRSVSIRSVGKLHNILNLFYFFILLF